MKIELAVDAHLPVLRWAADVIRAVLVDNVGDAARVATNGKDLRP
jgi:hypothetical protein